MAVFQQWLLCTAAVPVIVAAYYGTTVIELPQGDCFQTSHIDAPTPKTVVETMNYPREYPAGDSCSLILQQDSLMTVVAFNTERGSDFMLISGRTTFYSGHLDHSHMKLFLEKGTKITWKADYAVQKTGFQLFFEPMARSDSFTINDGFCLPAGNCVTSPKYPHAYGAEPCSLEVTRDGTLYMEEFKAELIDHLTMGGGSVPWKGLHNETLGATYETWLGEGIDWTVKSHNLPIRRLADDGVPSSTNGGAPNRWKICLERREWSVWNKVNKDGVLTFLCMLLLMGLVFLWDKLFYRRKMSHRTELSQVLQAEDEFRKAVHMHVLPGSSSAGSYNFRGLRQKAQTVSLEFNDLGLDLKNGNCVLQGVTGQFAAGKMVAIMGPSGAGKTTFMNVLCGKATYGNMRGEVKINGEAKPVSSLKPVMGFVPQDDIVHEKLTVRENVGFSAYLRNAQPTEKAHNLVIEDVLNVMQVRHIQQSIVGGVEARGISGGQRKRVNIGLEVAADPSLLFLDEPTSGLDATSSLTVIDALRKMTDLGTTIVMVIHQPRYSLFTLFDDVLLLGRGGRTVYLGPSSGALPYFEAKGFAMAAKENPADWFMDIISGEITCSKKADFGPRDLIDFWSETQAGELRSIMLRGRANSISSEEEAADIAKMFMHHITDAWAHVPNRSGRSFNYVKDSWQLSMPQLRQLLTELSGGCKPSDSVLSDMLGPYDEDTKCSKNQFLKFFRGTTVTQVDYATKESELLSHHPSLLIGTAATSGISRKQPWMLKQLRLMWRRRLIQVYRNNERRMVDIGLIFGCAIIAGTLHRNKMNVNLTLLPGNLMIFHLGLGLLVAVGCTKVFGADRPMFWRESASGISVLAFFLARTCVDLFELIIQTVVYVSVYYQLAWPSFPYVGFGSYFWPCMLVTFAASGWGYFISTVVPPESTITGAVIITLVLGGILGNPAQMGDFLSTTFGDMATMGSLSRWSVQMTFFDTMDAAREQGLEISQVLVDIETAYRKSYHGTQWAIAALVTMALVTRVMAFLGLKYMNRDKQV